MLATLVDWPVLGKVVLYSFAASLVLTTLFTTGVLLVEARDGRSASPAARALGIASFVVCVALVAYGLDVLFTTKK